MRWTCEAVYEELAPAVFGYFRGHGVRDPEGLTGDVFVGVTSSVQRFRGDRTALRRWVFTIAHHRLIDEYRRASRDPQQLVADVPDSSYSDESGEGRELTDALSKLTDEQRQVVVLRFIADLSIKDVAKVLGRSSSAVKMLQARGLQELRRVLLKDSVSRA